MQLYPPTSSSSSLGISSQLAKHPVLSWKPGSMFEQQSCMQSWPLGPHILSSGRLAAPARLVLAIPGHLPCGASLSLVGFWDCLLSPGPLVPSLRMPFGFLLRYVLTSLGESRLGETPAAQHIRGLFLSPGSRIPHYVRKDRRALLLFCPPKKLPRGWHLLQTPIQHLATSSE